MFMKNFITILLSLIAVVGLLVGALVIFDKIKNKNRIKGDYLDCETEEDTFEE